ncbi:unnamed protein product [Miscanthus lutarioriparius]|uniref:Phosphatidic acid phosphatase type 2/haloperoxidase domain-containing protein n=1 Tax=Miscanthus lutarioriparius TaxID=422564 RepID=A0A811NV23_9POAL|nr:unnamed protein product [Miscanthus lutarioriparius]
MQMMERVMELEEKKKLTVITLLWLWWGELNSFRGGVQRLATEVAFITALQADKFQTTKISSLNREGRVPEIRQTYRWLKPPEGVLKINSDGAFKCNERTGWWGFVIRDDRGAVVKAGAAAGHFLTDAFHAELLGFLAGLKKLQEWALLNAMNNKLKGKKEITVTRPGCFMGLIHFLANRTQEAMPAPAPPISLGAPTPYITSHGSKVARLHTYDWVVLVLLAVLDGVLNIIEPFHRFVGSEMMTDLRYPMKDNTVPFWAVPIIGIIGPIIIITAIYFKKRNVYDLHHAILGLLFSVLITAVLTDAIKDGVGRPRPDFFWRCFPDGIPDYNNFTTGAICHGEASVIKEGHKSFPSGHTSWSFAGLGFLSWYLAGKIKVFDRKGHVAKLCIVLSPLLLAALVAVSRVDDYWHHWQDVCTGGLLGLMVASICYLQFFPLPSDEKGKLAPRVFLLSLDLF